MPPRRSFGNIFGLCVSFRLVYCGSGDGVLTLLALYGIFGVRDTLWMLCVIFVSGALKEKHREFASVVETATEKRAF